MKKIICALGVVVSIGCSVKNKTVPHQPPAHQDRFEKSQQETGLYKPSMFTVFLWPEGLSRAELAVVVEKANRAADAIDKLARAYKPMMAEKLNLESDFSAKNCMQYSADDDILDYIENWKVAANEQQALEIESCKKNQDRRIVLQGAMEQNANIDRPEKMKALFSVLDVGYPEKIENNKVIDAKGCSFDIMAGVGSTSAVKATLKGFVDTKNYQTSVGTEEKSNVLGSEILGAQFNSENKMLKFSVPEVIDGVLTGGIYEFALERVDLDIGIRFAGDVIYTKNGVSRKGMAKMDGEFSK